MRIRPAVPGSPLALVFSLVAAVTALAVTAAGLAGCSARSGSADGEPATPSLSPSPSPSAEPPRIPSAPELPGRVIDLDFADEAHAFALLADCPEVSGFGDNGCDYDIAVLQAGAAWEVRDAPLPDGDLEGLGAVIEAASPGHARLYAAAATGPRDGGPVQDRAWQTADGGRTWQEGATQPTGTVDRIPQGAALSLAEDDRLAALMPRTAEQRLLATQPPLEELGEPGLLADGRHWVPGLDPATGRQALAVSGADGRGWELLAPLPTAPWHRDEVWHRGLELAGGGEQGLYAFETGPLPGVDAGMYGTGLLAIHRSDDGGASWERVWTHQEGGHPGSLSGTPIAAADGSLLVYAEDAIYASHDGGRTFEVARPGPPPEEPSVTRAGFLLRDLANPGHYRISADGFTWHTIVLGSAD